MPINISDVRRVEEKRRKAKKEMYIKMHDQFSRKIQHAVDHNQKSIVLAVPVFMFGFPRYNITAARRYMERQLTLSGFTIRNSADNNIFVTWVKESAPLPPPVHPSRDTMCHEEDATIPDLVNLRKLANKYRA